MIINIFYFFLFTAIYYEKFSMMHHHKGFKEAKIELKKAFAKAKDNNTYLSPNSKVIQNYKLVLPIVLPYELFQILIGGLLGDVRIRYNKNYTQASLTFE